MRLLRFASGLIDCAGEPITAHIEDVAEVLRSAADDLSLWLDGATVPVRVRRARCCAAVTALIEAGLGLKNSKTISPIKGILRLAADRLVEIATEVHPE